MNKRISSGYGLVLFELIIVIGFFAVFASVILRIFLSAHQISNESSKLSHAVIAAQNAAECFKASIEPTLYYDENWDPTDESDAVYRLSVDISSGKGMKTADVSVKSEEGLVIFSFTAKTLEE